MIISQENYDYSRCLHDAVEHRNVLKKIVVIINVLSKSTHAIENHYCFKEKPNDYKRSSKNTRFTQINVNTGKQYMWNNFIITASYQTSKATQKENIN